MPTVDTVRYDYLVNVLLTNGFPVLLVGPVGTGKTSTAQSVVSALDQHKYSLLVLNMSAQTSSKNVQVCYIYKDLHFRGRCVITKVQTLQFVYLTSLLFREKSESDFVQ